MTMKTSEGLAPLPWDALMPGAALLAWPAACATWMLQVQQEQFRAMATWQEMMSAAQRDWWDGWIARFGGGVPLDA